ncbi:MAG: hypothetical protein L0Y80_01345 [Ignavibacteriae bacterium]|nr:hypothetical protein [Ignavibacteriota bacterium]
MMKYTYIVLVLVSLLFPYAYSQISSELGREPGVVMRMGFGARGIGMGNALSSVRRGEISSYYNPALVPFQSTRTASAAMGVLSLDRSLNFLSYGQDLKPTAGVFFGIINAGVSDIDGRDLNGRHTETYSTSENAFILSFGTRISPKVSIGLTSKILYYSLFEGLSSTTVGFDVGFIYSFSDQLALSGVIQDLNSKYSWDTSTLYGTNGNTTIERFPLRRKVGLNYHPEYFESTVSAEIEFVRSIAIARFGAEIYPIEELALRSGIDQIDLKGDLSAKPSFGFTLKPDFGFVSSYIHYAYVIEPYSPHNIHMIAVSVVFD